MILFPVVCFDVKMLDGAGSIPNCKDDTRWHWFIQNTLNTENIFTCQITSEPENTQYKFLTIFKGSFFI